MRAWMIETPAGGEPQLVLREVSTPEPGPTELRVRVAAVGINRADILQVRGHYPPPPGVDPRIPGLEYAGTVEAVGERVQLYRPGDRVMGLVAGGAYAEALLTPEREAIAIPAGLDLVQAAAVPEDFLTAYRALYLEGGLAHGQWALIRPATAGVGLAAVQLVHVLGGRSLGSSRDRARLEAAVRCGLDVPLPEDEGALPERVRRATAGEGVAVVLDMLGGAAFADNLACLRVEGTLVVIGRLTPGNAELDLGAVLGRRLRIRGMTMRAQPLEERIRIARLFADRLTPLFERGLLRPLVSAVHPFDQAPQAHADMLANRHLGKLVLAMS
ncbi:MAG: NAD(P)H-quinone oxidoreductase [Fulvimonas sp.]|nr:NAD(P)H-quinone oxidoreductase [Fulvimonas sp.]